MLKSITCKRVPIGLRVTATKGSIENNVISDYDFGLGKRV